MEYRGVRVEPRFHLTSTGSGGGTLSVTELVARNNRTTGPPDYPNPAVVQRIAKELECSLERAQVLFDDLVRFLWMSSLTNETRIPTPAIDLAWHVFLLFTKDYAEFCSKYCGGFMHHEPHRGSEVIVTVDLVAPTIDHMHETFGEKPSANWDYDSFLTWKSAA